MFYGVNVMSNILDKFFNSDFASEDERDLRLVVASTFVAFEGLNPFSDSDDIENIVRTTDYALSIVKTGYKVATGSMSVIEVFDTLADKAQAIAIEAAEVVISKISCEVITEAAVKVGDAIGNSLGAGNVGEALRPVMEFVGRVAEEPIKRAVSSGIKAIGEVASTCIKKTIIVVKKAFEFVKSFF